MPSFFCPIDRPQTKSKKQNRASGSNTKTRKPIQQAEPFLKPRGCSEMEVDTAVNMSGMRDAVRRKQQWGRWRATESGFQLNKDAPRVWAPCSHRETSPQGWKLNCCLDGWISPPTLPTVSHQVGRRVGRAPAALPHWHLSTIVRGRRAPSQSLSQRPDWLFKDDVTRPLTIAPLFQGAQRQRQAQP